MKIESFLNSIDAMKLEPLTLSGLPLRNPVVLAPMTTYSSSPEGIVTQEELRYLGRRAKQGFGMVMTAACYVHKTGHAFPGQWRCDTDDVIASSLRPVADLIKRNGAAAVLQIHHGGRMGSRELSGRLLSASAIPSPRPGSETPDEMTLEEIREVISSFGQAARRAKESGYDGVEIHGANTYLLQQFVSPHSNRRTDAYGRDRNLFSTQVVESVLAAVGPDYPVGYRFSPEELETPGVRIGDTFALLDRLMGYQLAWLHVSISDFKGSSINGDYDEPTLSLLHRYIAGRIPLIGVGGVQTMQDIEDCLKMGCEFVAVAKAAITDPDWLRVVLNSGTPKLVFPKDDAESKLDIPRGLADRIRRAPGWLEIEA